MSESSNNGGTNIALVLFVVFLVLKLVDKIDWSWWWITSPLWIPAAVVAVFFAIGAGLAVLFSR